MFLNTSRRGAAAGDAATAASAVTTAAAYASDAVAHYLRLKTIQGTVCSFIPFAVLLVVDRYEDYRNTYDNEYEPAVLECVQPAPDEEYHESDHSDHGDVGFQCHSVSLLEV